MLETNSYWDMELSEQERIEDEKAFQLASKRAQQELHSKKVPKEVRQCRAYKIYTEVAYGKISVVQAAKREEMTIDEILCLVSKYAEKYYVPKRV